MGTGRVLIKFIIRYKKNRNFNGFQCKLCQEKTACRELTLANGTINVLSDVSQNGDIASFQCDPGYVMIPEIHFSICTANGTWSYDVPTCSGNIAQFNSLKNSKGIIDEMNVEL